MGWCIAAQARSDLTAWLEPPPGHKGCARIPIRWNADRALRGWTVSFGEGRSDRTRD